MGKAIKVPMTWYIGVAEVLDPSGNRELISIGYCPVGRGVSLAYVGDFPPVLPIAVTITFENGIKKCVGGDACINARCPLNTIESTFTSEEDAKTHEHVMRIMDKIVNTMLGVFGDDIFDVAGPIVTFAHPLLRFERKEGPAVGDTRDKH